MLKIEIPQRSGMICVPYFPLHAFLFLLFIMSLLTTDACAFVPNRDSPVSVADSDANSSISSFTTVGTDDIWAHFSMYEIFPRMEGTTLEFKQSIADLHQKKIPETLCGFLNTQGGNMIFGIRDDGYITGLSCGRKIIDDFLLHIDRIFHEAVIRATDTFERVHPSCVRTEVLTCHNGKPVVVVTVTPALDTQYQTKEGGVWYRLNASNYKITGSDQLYTEAEVRSKIAQTRKFMLKEFDNAVQNFRVQAKENDIKIRSLERTLLTETSASKESSQQIEWLTEVLHARILREKEMAEKEWMEKKTGSWLCGLF